MVVRGDLRSWVLFFVPIFKVFSCPRVIFLGVERFTVKDLLFSVSVKFLGMVFHFVPVNVF